MFQPDEEFQLGRHPVVALLEQPGHVVNRFDAGPDLPYRILDGKEIDACGGQHKNTSHQQRRPCERPQPLRHRDEQRHDQQHDCNHGRHAEKKQREEEISAPGGLVTRRHAVLRTDRGLLLVLALAAGILDLVVHFLDLVLHAVDFIGQEVLDLLARFHPRLGREKHGERRADDQPAQQRRNDDTSVLHGC